MNKIELLEWGKYTKWVEQQNKPMLDLWKKDFERQIKDRKQRDIENKALRNKLTNQYNASVRAYERLSFWKKWKTKKPEIPYRIRIYDYPLPLNMWMPIGIKPTYEGFLDWQLKQLREEPNH